MIELYYGDGKGKTTAATGLAVRAAGQGLPVLFVQFLKNDTSGEIAMLRKLGIETKHPAQFCGFVSRMGESERRKTEAACADMLMETRQWVEQTVQKKNDVLQAVVVLDEILHGLNYGLVSEETVCTLLRTYEKTVEFVLTGRNPSADILALADYITEMKKERHPYEWGISARKGIEL